MPALKEWMIEKQAMALVMKFYSTAEPGSLLPSGTAEIGDCIPLLLTP